MKISILMPTFNRPEFIRQAVDAALAQTTEIELIVKDGGESIYHLLPKDDRIIYIHSKDRGITHAMNTAMKTATGEVMCWANDDDLLLPNATEVVEREIGEAEWLYGKALTTDSVIMGGEWNYNRLLRENYIPQPAVFWKREAYELIGEMDEKNDLVSDYDYWIRLGQFGKPKVINDILATYTIHPGQITATRQFDQEIQANRVRDKAMGL